MSLIPDRSSQFRRPVWIVRLACLLACTAATAQTVPLPASDRLKRIESENNLRVCIWPEYYGISYRNPKTQKLTGLDVDNAADVAKALGVRLTFVNSSFAALIQDLQGDKCDLAMFAIGVTPERMQHLRFTQPYLKSDVYGITTLSNRTIKSWSDIDQPGVVVVVTQGTLHEPVMKATLKNAQLRIVNSPRAREEEVQSGRADVFMTDYPYSQKMLDNNDWARLVSPNKPFHITPYAWAMQKGDEAFAMRIEDVLTGLKQKGRLLDNARKYHLQGMVVP